jgi:hypothetical protein
MHNNYQVNVSLIAVLPDSYVLRQLVATAFQCLRSLEFQLNLKYKMIERQCPTTWARQIVSAEMLPRRSSLWIVI